MRREFNSQTTQQHSSNIVLPETLVHDASIQGFRMNCKRIDGAGSPNSPREAATSGSIARLQPSTMYATQPSIK